MSPRVGDIITRGGCKARVLERTAGKLWQLRVEEFNTGREVWITDAWYHFTHGTLVVEESPGRSTKS